MEIKEITNKEQWDEKIGSFKQSQFLQSWEWGEFQENLGRKVWRLYLDGDFALVIKMPLPMNKSYLYIPRTCVTFNEAKIKILRELAKQEKSIFIKIEPIKQNLLDFGLKKVKSFQPQKTLILDLSKSEEELLMAMHQKTRYNIRLADKKGVKIKEGRKNDFDVFYNLMLNTYQRKNKKLFSKEYYQKLINNISEAKIYLAEFEEKVICANLIMFYGDTVTYLHGGSAQEHKNVMAPYLLQWETIKKAKELGYKYYDFWGIEEHYLGVARFKKGFGGIEIEYPGTFDLVMDKLWYWAYQVVKKFK